MNTPSVSFVFAAFLSAAVFFFSSCSEDEGGVSSSGKASLRIHVAGISAGGEQSLTRAALEPQTVVLTADDGTPVEFILSVDPASVTRATSPMATGNKYRVIVYKSDGTYVTEAEFTAGFEGSITDLDHDTPYRFVALSYNTTTAPSAVGSDADGDGDPATITVDPSNDLLHWVDDVTIPSGSTSLTVDITFKHRFPKLTVRITSTLTGCPITTVPASATLTPGYKGKLTLLSSGALARNGTASDQTFLFNTTNNDTVAASTTTRHVFFGATGDFYLSFSGTLTVNAPTGPKTLTNPVVGFAEGTWSAGGILTMTMRVVASKGNFYPIEGGSTYETLPIPLGTTYNYTDASGNPQSKNSLVFLRYNLGADPSMTPKQQMAYPHTDNKNIRVYGGYFQWGRSDVEHSLRDPKTSTNENVNFQNSQYTYYNGSQTKFVWSSSYLIRWLSSDVDYSNLWGNGGSLAQQTNFQHNSGTPRSTANSYNPCPSGYRVPTQHEWALIANEGGSSTDTIHDHFIPTINGLHTSSSGTTWYVPMNNTNVVWVRVSNKKASTSFSYDYMNGYALYDAANTAIDSPTKRNTVFATGNDLTDGAAPNPLMFLPAAGFRSYNASVASSYGQYWSSTIFNANAYDPLSLRFYYNSVRVPTFIRSYGCSVRCIKA